MLVLHSVGAVGGRVALWAEDSRLPARVVGRLPRATVRHPFAVGGADLRALLDGGEVGELRLRLPSFASGPVASPELVREEPVRRGALRWREWVVPVLWWDGAVPARLPDCRFGVSAKFLGEAVEFGLDLVRRGRVLPVIDGDRTARWRAALSGVDSLRHAALRTSTPASFLAADPTANGGGSAAGVSVDVLTGVLDRLVDREVRRLLSGTTDGADAADGEVVGRWLAALVGDPSVDHAVGEVDRLRHVLGEWAARGLRELPVRTCFRLGSPDQGDPRQEDWRVEFLLQAVDEPSVLVSAERLWRRGDTALRRWVDRPEEVLLGDLGRAGRLYPALDRALAAKRPVELVLDVEGAYDFLTHAPLLAQAGFGVLLPAWWRQPNRLGLVLDATGRGTAGTVAKESELGLRALVDYRWELALGDERLTEAELGALAKAKVPLIRLRGRWVHVDRKRLAAGLAFLGRGGGRMSAARVLLHSGLHPDDAGLPLPLNGVRADGWLGDLLSGEVEHRLEPVEDPPGLVAELRPYQRRGLAWLAFLDRLGLGACLADDMGLGKTVQLLALEAHNRRYGRRPPTLLVCPVSVVGNWQREAARFTPGLRVRVHHGADRALDADCDLVITTYAVLARDASALAGVAWDRVVLDEAQNVKNSATRQSEVVRSLPARHRVALTGTPVENRLAELWSIMDFVNPGLLGSINTFRARFAVPVERHHDEDAAVRLRRITGPFVLRRLKTDPKVITDLPDKIEVKQLCTLTAEQASLYQAVVDDMFQRIAEAEGIKRRGLVLATMSRLKQVCNHPAQLLRDGSRVAGRSGKLARLEEVLEEALADGDKALCFTQFTEFGSLVAPHLAARFDTEVLFLHGGTPKRARDEMVRRFQDPGGPSVFVLSLKAGGTGLNLTAATHVIHLDRWWNPAVEDQATDRAFRIGQRDHVQVRKFVCVGTLEERIDLMIEEKRDLAQLVVGAGEDWLTELSTGELHRLFALSGEAVGG
ncbi:DEAD/DEAH box helicase [Saccharothrix syringae]|uniref:DEAD/DEAH box helicase n=1 Tax=Saccharothrix syringae TaxID=103733 RepID=A0A5Q0GTZ6_SACSY|nr:DEAD/DEAH box helicase [Saccharothrix syringae]QFZ17105.1 DEAD/DEAH box helicase [Saccharothrix syringae]